MVETIVCDKSKGYKPNDSDFIEFSKQLHDSEDIDPVYPVLAEYFRMRNFSLEEKLFGVHLYLTFYNTYWTLVVLERYRDSTNYSAMLEFDFIREKKLKFGSDRRGVRAIGLATVFPQFDAFFNKKPLSEYFLKDLTDDGEKNYELMKKKVLDIPHNGSWAGYKMIDLLTYCAGLNIKCTDWWVKGRAFGGKQLVVDWEIGMGEDYKLGKTLPETDEIVRRIEAFADRWTARLQKEVSPRTTYDRSETMACKYHALYGKTYYAGHDIDKMQEEICGYDKNVDDLLYHLREVVLPKEYLGEHNGWKGVRKELKGKLIKGASSLVVPIDLQRSGESDGQPDERLGRSVEEREAEGERVVADSAEASQVDSKETPEAPAQEADAPKQETSAPTVTIRQPIKGSTGVLVVDPYSYRESKHVNRKHPALIEKLAAKGELNLCYFPVEPFHYREKKRHATQIAMETCVKHHIPMSVETRQEVPDWAIEALSREKMSEIRIQLNTLDAKKWRLMYPDSPDPKTLLRSYVRCFNGGVYTILKIAPIVPGIVEDFDVYAVIDTLKNWTSVVEICFASFDPADLEALEERVPKSYNVRDFYTEIGGRYYVDGGYRVEFLRKLNDFTSGWKLQLKPLNEIVTGENGVQVFTLKSK